MLERSIFFLAIALALPALAKHAKKEHFKILHPSELSAALKSPHVPAVFDATPETRAQEGSIPGAHLLSSYDRFDLAKELPGDKNTPLVFYCASTMCMASHEAAERAIGAGYKDVGVMVDGIKGWKKAGLPVEKVAKS